MMGPQELSARRPDSSRLTRGVPNAQWSESIGHGSVGSGAYPVPAAAAPIGGDGGRTQVGPRRVDGAESQAEADARAEAGAASTQQQQQQQASQAHPREAAWPRGFLMRYELEQVIGHGASSEVFAARVRATGESVAVKRVFKRRCCVGARATRRLRDEVRVLSTLKHPHVVEMHEVWESPTELYIVMERALGGELFDRIVDRGTFSEAEAKIVMRQLLSALSDMHRRGFIHRDVKPENLLLTTADGWDIKLSDFGLVKTLEDDDELLSPLSRSPAFPPAAAAVRAQQQQQQQQQQAHHQVPPQSTHFVSPPPPPPQQQPQYHSPYQYPSGPQPAHHLAGRAGPAAGGFGYDPRAAGRTLPGGYVPTAPAASVPRPPQQHGFNPHVSQVTPHNSTLAGQTAPPKRQRRPSFGEALETVDEQNEQNEQATPPKPAPRQPLPETDPLDGVHYYYSTAGVDVQLNGGPIVAQVGAGAVAPAALEQISAGGAGAYRLSEEQAFALLKGLPHDSAERDVADLFRRARTHTLCGSPYYMAPEVCYREKYGPAVDIWSAGVVMYILLTGSPPWDQPPQFGAAPSLDVQGELAQVSHLGVDLLLQMLKAIPDQRCTAAEALRHPWLAGRTELATYRTEHVIVPTNQDHGARGLSPHFDSAIRTFCEKRKRGAPSTNLDMTPVANAMLSVETARWPVEATQPRRPDHGPSDDDDDDDDDDPEPDLVRQSSINVAVNLKRNRQHSRLGGRGADASIRDHDYDTFSSGGSDDGDDDDVLSPKSDHSEKVLPPAQGRRGPVDPISGNFRLSLDDHPSAVQFQKNRTW